MFLGADKYTAIQMRVSLIIFLTLLIEHKQQNLFSFECWLKLNKQTIHVLIKQTSSSSFYSFYLLLIRISSSRSCFQIKAK